VVDKNRNNFSHTTPKELQMVAKDAGSRWDEAPRKSALESKIHKCKSGFDQRGVDEEKRETHTWDIQSTGRRIDSRVRSNDYWWYDRNACQTKQSSDWLVGIFFFSSLSMYLDTILSPWLSISFSHFPGSLTSLFSFF
jgi:hypothetical protein